MAASLFDELDLPTRCGLWFYGMQPLKVGSAEVNLSLAPDRYQARRQLRNQCQQIAPRHLRLDQHRLAAIINPMQGEYTFGEIDSCRDHTHRLPLSNE